MSAGTLERLMRWYGAQTDGDWEHSYGVHIETLDNPGWHVRIDLTATVLEDAPFSEVQDAYNHETDWLMCRRIGSEFDAACGAHRLSDVLEIFLDWAESSYA